VLRDLVHLGFNPHLEGRQVFDGILPIVAGSRRTCINWQFAQAGRYSRQHEDHSYGDDQFPFSYPTLSDPISGRSGSILQRARDAGVCPKVLHLDTESDLSQARSSLVVTDTNGADIVIPNEVRVYTVSGVSQAIGSATARSWARCWSRSSSGWSTASAPPDSRFPSCGAGTLVPLAAAPGRWCRSRRRQAAAGKLPQRSERAAAARMQRLREIVEGFFFRHHDDQGQPLARHLLVKSPPGLGKTKEAMEWAPADFDPAPAAFDCRLGMPRTGAVEAMTDTRLGCLLWGVVDHLDYLLTLASLRILDALAGPLPETPADQQRQRDRERIERAFPRDRAVRSWASCPPSGGPRVPGLTTLNAADRKGDERERQ
jgi:hypothetical protein